MTVRLHESQLNVKLKQFELQMILNNLFDFPVNIFLLSRNLMRNRILNVLDVLTKRTFLIHNNLKKKYSHLRLFFLDRLIDILQNRRLSKLVVLR